ncbi:MAG: hypothetical protein GW772_10705 [Flavobacteriia bacterium]|nr:hypothetical protein [Flavobacteriia bacterium]OIP45474.1 MAG: hypothetical protein AUK46_11525 [Flavobacteriaceae bacterium CG2_30_31_66]PIV97637.1 MAG: hypothetical protein COW43_01975 [Flavobacteriaceae bacterium CG17_big_fil_post_rev_8_21_14_2_50_31_13]PIX11547.1 MAG: hypothetical protein COZ74_13810 [Flavobacteriaceae bacterium CG_4_8_14_3_um_filter_31_8]PIY14904.1 MAG: hypothetical protein COZ16_06345 [Flavobacteriaceae bacterium CG_4_10_14_3_um_filter_31_253]PIZ11744.1 MAG: hypotheti
MKNLQSFGVQELDAKEVRETEGGIIGPIFRWLGSGIVTGAAIELITEGWGNCKKDFWEGFNEVRK